MKGNGGAYLEYACASLAIIQFDNAQDSLAKSPRRFHERQHGDFDSILIHIIRNLLRDTCKHLDSLTATRQAARWGSMQLLIVHHRRHAH